VNLLKSVESRAVFLDRDGVINRPILRNRKPYPPQRLDEFVLLPAVSSAISDLKSAGYMVIVVTNQPDVARGTQSRETVERMHDRLRAELPLDDIMVCWHDDVEDCDCRKPRPGLMLSAGRKYGIDMAASFMVGDRWRDVDAGSAAGCCSLLIDYGYNERAPDTEPAVRTRSLREAVDWILGEREEGTTVEPGTKSEVPYSPVGFLQPAEAL
jgi:D-glycero-D-manno-heptose 1,7-bisphosphate phosphatase